MEEKDATGLADKVMKLSLVSEAALGMVASGMKIMGNCAFNGTFPFTFNLPDIVKNAIQITDADTDALAAIKKGLLFNIFPIKVAETGNGRTVESTAQQALLDYLTDRALESDILIKGVSKTALKNINASYGQASDTSSPDGMCIAQDRDGSFKIGLAVIELKDTTISPLEQIGQAYAAGCNIILSHLKLGIDAKDCAVPLVFTNGNLYQFGWITLLEPSFSVLHLSTGILDANTYPDEVATHLTALKRFCREMVKKNSGLINSKSFQSKVEVCLNRDLYHLKISTQIFFRYANQDESFHYMWRTFEALKDVSAVVKPLGYALLTLLSDNKSTEISDGNYVIFPRLKDYSMGVPLKDNLFADYLFQMKEFLRNIHGCGVIHMDLYPSNILWKNENETIQLGVVDWDVATFKQDSFSKLVEERLENESISQYYYKKKGSAEPKCDYWFVYILSRMNQSEKVAMNGDINQINKVYRDVVDRCAQEAGDRDKLTILFDSWYEDSQ